MIKSIHKARGGRKGKYCICVCDYCGKEFERQWNWVKRAKHHYCNWQCRKVGYKPDWEVFDKINKTRGRNKPRLNYHGYIIIHKPEHPYCDKNGYVLYHRLIMEKHLGRYLKKGEVIHHINVDRIDNRIENLQLYKSIGYHTNYHRRLNKLAMVKK